jgi:hypothetical protein
VRAEERERARILAAKAQAAEAERARADAARARAEELARARDQIASERDRMAPTRSGGSRRGRRRDRSRPEPVRAPTEAAALAPAGRRARRAPAPPAAKDRRRSSPPRARRAPRRRETGDRRFWTRVMPSIAAALALAVVVGAVARRDDGGAARHPKVVATPPVSELPVLLVHRGAAGTDLLAIADRDGDQGSVLLVPVATQLDVPSEGTSVLADISTADGGTLLTNSVENEVGVRIGRTVILDDAGLTAALGPAAPIAITLADPVGFADRSTKYRQGAQQVSAAQASELMSAPESVNELDRLVVVAAVIDGWMDRLRDASIGKVTRALQPALKPLVAASDASGRRIDTVPVTSIATGGGERFDVRPGELSAILRRAFPHSQLGERGRRPRVEILNGTGALGVAQAVALKVVPAGGQVTLTNNLPGFGLRKTQVVYADDAWRSAAQRLLDAMGCGSLRKTDKDIGVADVSILVGSDCPAYGSPGGGT